MFSDGYLSMCVCALCVCVCVSVHLSSDAPLVSCVRRTRIGPDCGGHRGCTQMGLGSHGSPCGWCT